MSIFKQERRKRVMTRSIALGHCVCDPRKPCPCPVFKKYDVCECAGERRPMEMKSSDIKLTQLVKSAGCASKIDKKLLESVLSELPEIDDPRVILGSASGDDAGIVKLPGIDQRLVFTVDVFAPSVDDPFTFGEIAAANSVSDIYAMGATPLSAVSVICFPSHSYPPEIMRAILEGGVAKMREAETPVVGGHSVNDEELKCGFAVTGLTHGDDFLTNSNARPGDAIVLTKPIGTGIVAFANQIGRCSEESTRLIIDSMLTLNKIPSRLMLENKANAATDVTGFSLLGHLYEVVKNSKVEVRIDFDSVPMFPGVADLSSGDVLPGAVERNRESVPEQIISLDNVDESKLNVLFSPETSGGLLVFMPLERARTYVKGLQDQGFESVSIIGEVAERSESGAIRISSNTRDWEKVVQTSKRHASSATKGTERKSVLVHDDSTPSCCASPPELDDSTTSRAPIQSASDAFQSYMGAVNAPGAIDLKTKKLMALALSIVTKCEPCVKLNTDAAREAGATEDEIAEAAALGIAFGGAPTAMFYNMVRQKR